MKILSNLSLALGLTLIAGGAGAATYTFGIGSTATGTSYGNTRTTNNLTVSALSDTAAGGALASAYVWRDGSSVLGNINQDVSDDGTVPIGSSPNHAVDNDTHQDSLLLSFSGGAVNLSGFSLGWAREYSGATLLGSRADVALLAFTGNSYYDPLGHSYTDLLSNGWSLISEYSNVAQGTNQSTGTAVNSSYWMLAAAGGAFGSGYAGASDYFKLQSITATPCLPGQPGCGGSNIPSVPEPSSLALAGLALAGVFRMRRRGT
ncbi:MAG: PEP-CTERM sorting domain-containing protein [Rhodocyclaceae bacterium]|nr:PEP-CTERM sorting domain-containing protein [Rhodocyclaceae bacterium]